MNISRISFNSFTGYQRHSYDTFRDDELFQDTDSIDTEYSRYDSNDLPVKNPTKNILDYDYSQIYSVTTPPSVRPINPAIRYTQMDNLSDIKDSIICIDEDLLNACLLETKNKKRFSGTLCNHLKKIKEEQKYSMPELAELCNTVKLKKANGNEYIDYEFLQAGLYCMERLSKDFDRSEIKELIKEFITTDKKGNEVFCDEAFGIVKGYCKCPGKRTWDMDTLIESAKVAKRRQATKDEYFM